MRISLRAKIVMFAIAMALIPLLILSVALLAISYNAQRDEVLSQQQEQATQIAGQVSATLDEIQLALDVVARTSDWESLEPWEQKVLVDTLFNYRTRSLTGSGVGAFDEVLFLDTEGLPVAGKTVSRMMSLEEWGKVARAEAYEQVMPDDEYRGPVYLSQAMVATMNMAVPARDLPGRINGILWGAVDVARAMSPIITGPGIHADTRVYVTDGNGYLVARNDEHFVQRDQPLNQLRSVRAANQGTSQGIETYLGLAGEEVVGAWQPVPGTDWTLVIEQPTRQAFADVYKLLTPAAILSLVTILVAVAAGVLASQVLIRPVGQLRQGAEIIGQGNLDYRIQIKTKDEIGSLAQAFNQMASNLQTSSRELEEAGQEMENRIEERTHELAIASEQMERRAAQLQASAEVARAITSIRDLDVMLPRVAQLINEQFDWYHVGIFLLEPSGEYAVLRAASSEGGRRMMARGHRLAVGKAGIVGFVTHTGQARIALDVGQDAVYFDSPELHGTRSEMALPLQIGDQIIGALDVQSTQPQAYDDEDVAILTVLSDQVAIAIENALRFEQTQQALEEVQRLHRQYVEHEWTLLTTNAELAYEYRRGPGSDGGTIAPAASPPPEFSTVMTKGEIVTISGRDDAQPAIRSGDNGGHQLDEPGPAYAALAAPIKYRDQIIGSLDLLETEESREWTEDDVALVEAVSDQLALALENARLFSDAQRRAEQMTTLNRIGLDLASGLELDRVLESLYEQCRQVLVTDTFYVALHEENTDTITFPLLTGRDGTIPMDPVSIHDEPGFTGYIIQSGRLLHVPDTHNIPDGVPYKPRQISDLPNRAYLGMPLTARGRVFGVLSIQARQPSAYSAEDVELLTTIATQAAIAIENAQSYERLVETADELREVDRLKTQFLANMSHELRTPLNSIIGFSRVMLKGIDGPITDLQETDLGSIYNSGQHLLSLINSILDMSKIEAGKMDLAFDEVHLDDVFKAVISTTTALVKDLPVELRTDLPDDLPTVWADAQRVRQVLINLMSNASKFTEEGHIVLKARADEAWMTISVVDTGMGIEPEAQQRLFIPFQQVDASTTRRAGGTGLGLAICRSFVEMHGGDIWVESESGQGATFSFTLPLYSAAMERITEEGKGEADLDPGSKVVLAIDDDAGVITLLKRYLEGDGYQVVGLQEPAKALDTARKLAPVLTAITLDIVMPNMDGWQVLRALQQEPTTKDIPVILCSIVEGLEQGLGMGATACLRKPVTRDEMLDALNKLKR